MHGSCVTSSVRGDPAYTLYWSHHEGEQAPDGYALLGIGGCEDSNGVPFASYSSTGGTWSGGVAACAKACEDVAGCIAIEFAPVRKTCALFGPTLSTRPPSTSWNFHRPVFSGSGPVATSFQAMWTGDRARLDSVCYRKTSLPIGVHVGSVLCARLQGSVGSVLLCSAQCARTVSVDLAFPHRCCLSLAPPSLPSLPSPPYFSQAFFCLRC